MEDESHNWNTFIAGEYHFATQAREISDEKNNFRLAAFKVKRGTCPLSCQGNFGLEADLRTQCIILAAAWLITSWSLVVDDFVIHWLYWLVYLDSVWFSYIFPESLVFGKFLETVVSTGDVACFHYIFLSMHRQTRGKEHWHMGSSGWVDDELRQYGSILKTLNN